MRCLANKLIDWLTAHGARHHPSSATKCQHYALPVLSTYRTYQSLL